MIRKVLSFVERHHMIERGEHILAGVSGGADSVCLLLVLERLREKYGCSITAVHVEHGIRGEDSLRDARFVEELCRKHHMPCQVYHCDAVAFSRDQGMSLEEGARELRYRYFEQARQRYGADKIAVAHNQNDSAETLLFHLARGTGLKGMSGIVPVRDVIIRPLLCVGRKEIEAFLREEKQDFCTDITNFETEYSRNKIRHQILPVLEEVNDRAVSHLYRSTEYLAEAAALVEQLAGQAREDCVSEFPGSEGTDTPEDSCPVRPKGFLIQEQLKEHPLLVQKTLVQQLLGECAGSRKDIADVHVTQVLGLFQKQVGRRSILPYEMTARRTYGGIVIEKDGSTKEKDTMETSADLAEKGRSTGTSGIRIEPGEIVELPEYGWRITGRILEKTKEFHEIPKKRYTKWFDYDKIKGTLLLRKRCQGDYFVIDALGREQKLKKYFVNEKIPAGERDEILLLADGMHILWAIGYRISEAYKVTEDTKRILEIQVNGGNIYE